ncbi:hypothetical protein TNCV_3365921 [Trichonephila clavipes]|nr:hypothetical protein TNCV_3365921 [Trichonephila clavipes]
MCKKWIRYVMLSSVKTASSVSNILSDKFKCKIFSVARTIGIIQRGKYNSLFTKHLLSGSFEINYQSLRRCWYIIHFLNLVERGIHPFSSFFSNTETREASVPEPDEIGNLIEEVDDFVRQINLEVNSDGIQELLDSHIQELTVDELIKMREQKQGIE